MDKSECERSKEKRGGWLFFIGTRMVVLMRRCDGDDVDRMVQ